MKTYNSSHTWVSPFSKTNHKQRERAQERDGFHKNLLRDGWKIPRSQNNQTTNVHHFFLFVIFTQNSRRQLSRNLSSFAAPSRVRSVFKSLLLESQGKESKTHRSQISNHFSPWAAFGENHGAGAIILLRFRHFFQRPFSGSCDFEGSSSLF